MEGAHRQSLLKLIKQLKGDSLVGAEVGVHRARTSGVLLKEEQRIRRLWMIDLWRPAPEESDYWKSGDPCARRSIEECEDHFREACSIAMRHGRRADIVRKDSVEAGRQFQLIDPLDFVFLDAAHDEAGVYADIQAWYPVVRQGGLLSGHDYHDPSGSHHDGVKVAVDRFAAEHNLLISTMPGNVWFTIKP